MHAGAGRIFMRWPGRAAQLRDPPRAPLRAETAHGAAHDSRHPLRLRHPGGFDPPSISAAAAAHGAAAADSAAGSLNRPAIRDWLSHPDRALSLRDVGFCRSAGRRPSTGGARRWRISRRYSFRVIDAVILLPRHQPDARIDEWLRQCEIEGIEAWLLPDFLRRSIAAVTIDELAGEPMLLFSSTAKSAWALMIKRMLDVVIAALGLLVLAPLMLGLAIAIRATSPGPVFFVQRRSTLRGRIFNMYKFRTMITNAEAIRDELEHRNEVSGPVFKMKDDPRITPLGRWLRRYSLDELPQLWNVLKGDMSLVGPRPPIPTEVEKYENWQRRRLSMRAGCTSLWQISGRNNLPFEEWMRLDLKYIDTWSLGLDFKIMFQTIGVVFRGTGY